MRYADLVTLKQARQHIQSTHSADDDDLGLKIDAASQAVLTYLKIQDRFDMECDLYPVVKQAILIMVAEMYKNREGEQDGEIDQSYGYGYLPRPVVALLYPHRDPSVA